MKTCIALLRGINVGGRNKLAMRDLVKIFLAEGCHQVRTYIQSGNVVFKANFKSEDAFLSRIRGAIENAHGFSPDIFLLDAETLGAAIDANPYREAEVDPKSVHVFFLADAPPIAQIEKAREFLSSTESMTIDGNWLYLHAPDGIARSKVAGQVDRLLRTSVTARNWRTLNRLAQMAAAAQ